MGLYSRALRHVDMNRVKELREDKIRQKKIAEEIREQIREELRNLNSPEFSNWRHELNETMTTSDVFYTTLPAVGDTTLDTTTWSNYGGANNVNTSGYGGNTITLSGDPSPYIYNGGIIGFPINVQKYDTLLVDVTTGGTRLLMYGSSANGFPKLIDTTSSGTYTIDISNESNTSTWTVLSAGSGTVSVSNPRFQRRTPLSVFVGLDSPEASSFMRVGGDSSPEERKQKLKEMLEASDEYLAKTFGNEFPGTGLDPKVGEAGDTPGVETIDYGTDLTPLSDNPYGTEMGQIGGTYDLIKSGQVPYMKPEKAKQILSNPKYQKLWDDDPDALRIVQRLAGA